METDVDKGRHVAEVVHRDLLAAGFLPNYEKSVWEPCSNLEWLGFMWNMNTGCLGLEADKLKRFQNEAGIRGHF